MVLDGSRVLEETRMMKRDVESGQFDRDQLSVKYQFLFANVLHLFDIVYENKFNYMPMIKNLCDRLNTIKDNDNEVSLNKAHKQVDIMLYNQYVSPVLDDPELDRVINEGNVVDPEIPNLN